MSDPTDNQEIERLELASRMDDDIVVRLRNYDSCTDRDVDEAADEIEQLREGLEGLKSGVAVRIADLEAEVARLTAERDEWKQRAIRNNPGTVDGAKAYMAACEREAKDREDYSSKRCLACGWPLAATAAEGCVPGNCSERGR